MLEEISLLEKGEAVAKRRSRYSQHNVAALSFIAVLLFIIMQLINNSEIVEVESNECDTVGSFLYADEYTAKIRANIESFKHRESDSNVTVPFQHALSSYKTANKYKVAYFGIMKTMSTVMTNIFCYLYDPEDFLKKKQTLSVSWAKRSCAKINEYRSLRDMKQFLKNESEGYRFITVTRDPLARFESGYLDKCIREKRPCFDCDLNDIYCILNTLKNYLDTTPNILDLYNKQNPFIYYLVLHMAPQTWYGELLANYQYTTFLQYASSGTKKVRMAVNLADQLQNLNIPFENSRYVLNNLLERSKTKHSTHSMGQKSLIQEKILTDEKLYNLFLSIFKYDYDIFDYPIPEKNF